MSSAGDEDEMPDTNQPCHYCNPQDGIDQVCPYCATAKRKLLDRAERKIQAKRHAKTGRGG